MISYQGKYMSKELQRFYEAEIVKMNSHPELKAFERKMWDGKINNSISKNYKISLCTTCMGRLSDLSVCLLKNIEDNADYDNLEFVILDYNSKDGLGNWVKENLMGHIESGRVVYARTEEPEFYSMTRSRNLAFKVASGDIVNNLDADNFTNRGFASYLNMLANQQTDRAIFAKGKKMLRGRLGFWKKEFMEDLCGYEEDINDYGHDDWDLMLRAWKIGFRLMFFGGTYYANTGSKKHQTGNMKVDNWKFTESRNKYMSMKSIIEGATKANVGREWGKGNLIKNFNEEVIL